MALVRLSDVVIPAVYNTIAPVNSPEKTAFVQSGVVMAAPEFAAYVNGPSNIYNLPFWNDLDASGEPNYSTDNPADVAVPDKAGMDQMLARTAYINKGFSDADLVKELLNSDPMTHIRNRFGMYWQRQFQRRITAILSGMMAANVAQNSGDMVNNISVTSAPGAGNLLSRAALTTAVYTLGDAADMIKAIAVHSIIMKRMVDNNDIDYIPDADGKLSIPTYMGLRVIVDDGMPVANPSAGVFQYTSVLFGQAALAYAEGSPSLPFEVDRKPDQGNGGGVEIVWERKTWLIHPFGFSFTSNTVTGQSATWANLRLAANWQRKVPRKNIPLAFLVTNG